MKSGTKPLGCVPADATVTGPLKGCGALRILRALALALRLCEAEHTGLDDISGCSAQTHRLRRRSAGRRDTGAIASADGSGRLRTGGTFAGPPRGAGHPGAGTREAGAPRGSPTVSGLEPVPAPRRRRGTVGRRRRHVWRQRLATLGRKAGRIGRRQTRRKTGLDQGDTGLVRLGPGQLGQLDRGRGVLRGGASGPAGLPIGRGRGLRRQAESVRGVQRRGGRIGAIRPVRRKAVRVRVDGRPIEPGCEALAPADPPGGGIPAVAGGSGAASALGLGGSGCSGSGHGRGPCIPGANRLTIGLRSALGAALRGNGDMARAVLQSVQ
jgi:hypothetical protein